ncbi:MAG: hypothetical protein GY898_00825 [Proteobacteria bacterium]|nr:hypothetical protein [Pseudomonadota bacterium]
MSSIRTMLIALALAAPLTLVGCGGDDGGGEPAADAGHDAAPAAAAPADAAPAEAEAAPAEGGTGGGEAGDIKGTWGISMSAEEQAQLDAAKAALEANPEDQMSKAMVEMMTAMLESMSLTITDDTMTMAMGENTEDVKYTMEGDAITSTDAEGKSETLTVSWDGDTMVWNKEGEEKAMRWNRK